MACLHIVREHALKRSLSIWPLRINSRKLHMTRELGDASLRTISLEQIKAGDTQEHRNLLSACEKDGFFYLNVQNSHGRHLLEKSEFLYNTMRYWFRRPLCQKMKFHHDTVLHGYTPVGTYAGLNENARDGNESIKITDEAQRSPLSFLPDLYLENRVLLDTFKDQCRELCVFLLSVLSDAIGLNGEDRFEHNHRSYAAANSCLNLFCYPRKTSQTQFGQNKHTDNGSLTLLFSQDPGLEVLSPSTAKWNRVAPRPGHIVINVGDTLRFLSRNRLHSSIHRAAPIFTPDQQERLVIGYFLRAEDDLLIQDSEGRTITARQWHDGKYETYKASHSEQRTTTILTGGMERYIDT